jgi:hypothetical protein
MLTALYRHLLLVARASLPSSTSTVFSVGQLNLGGRNENPFEFKIPSVCPVIESNSLSL